MRPKKTFRDPRLKQFVRGKTRLLEDGELDAELAALLTLWREKYQRFEDRTFNPPMMDIRATLEALTEIPDDRADSAVRLLDSHTSACIKHAAWLDYRREIPEPAPIPPNAMLIRKPTGHGVGLAISPQRLRELAALALSVLPKDVGGRPRINSLDHLFACELVRHWLRIYGTKPTVHYYGTPFTEWAADMFNRVGLPRVDHDKVLRDAINEAIKKG